MLRNFTELPEQTRISPASSLSVPHDPGTGLSRDEMGASPVMASIIVVILPAAGAVMVEDQDVLKILGKNWKHSILNYMLRPMILGPKTLDRF